MSSITLDWIANKHFIRDFPLLPCVSNQVDPTIYQVMVPSTLRFGANFGSALPSGPLPTTPPSMELENSTGGNLEHPDGPSSGHHVNSQVARPFSDENRQDARSPPSTPIWEQIRLPNPMPERERLQGVQNYGTWYPRILNRLRQMSLAQFALGIARCPEILISTRECECGDTITNRFHLVDQATLGYINDQLSNEIMCATRNIMTSCKLLAFLGLRIWIRESKPKRSSCWEARFEAQ